MIGYACWYNSINHSCSVRIIIIRILRLGGKFANFDELYTGNGYEHMEQLWYKLATSRMIAGLICFILMLFCAVSNKC